MGRKYEPIHAVHEDDLANLLKSVGLLANFEAGKLKCKFCKCVVTRENIYSVIKDSDTYKVISSDAECVSALMDYLDKKRQGKLEL